MSTILLFLATLLPSNEIPNARGPLVKSAVKTGHAVRLNATTVDTQYGSGTIIMKDDEGIYVLSCCHIAKHGNTVGGGKLSVMLFNNKWYAAKLVHYDVKKDLSLIRVETRASVDVAVLAKSSQYKAGKKIIKCGFPNGEDLVITLGECADFSTTSNGYTNLIASAESTNGDSGGGVFRASDTSLVGVIWGGRPDGLRAVRIDDIRSFLKEAVKKDKNFKLE